MAPSGGLEERKRRARPPRPHRRGFGPRSCQVARVATGDFGKRLERHGYVLKKHAKVLVLNDAQESVHARLEP